MNPTNLHSETLDLLMAEMAQYVAPTETFLNSSVAKEHVPNHLRQERLAAIAAGRDRQAVDRVLKMHLDLVHAADQIGLEVGFLPRIHETVLRAALAQAK